MHRDMKGLMDHTAMNLFIFFVVRDGVWSIDSECECVYR